PAESEVFYPAVNRWFAVHVSVSGDHLCVFLHDVTERARLERERRRRAEELAEAARGKDTFLLQLAHEVRNALAPIRDALHLAGSGDLGEECLRACALAEQKVRHLSRLMDDLLQVSQAAAPPNKERVNLAGVVARAVAGAL